MKCDAYLSPLPAGRSEVLCTKSWTAYVRPTAIAAIAVLGAAIVLMPLGSVPLAFVVMVAILGAYAASVLSLWREMLMIDDEGVWYCRGRPGARPRMVGVRWRYVHCHLSKPRIRWLRRPFTVVIRNRMTCREITIRHMKHADRAIARIGSVQRMRRHDARQGSCHPSISPLASTGERQ